MIGLIQALFCIVCIFMGDVREQSGGYNTYTVKLQVYVGAAGAFFYFVGFLGIYDCKLDWISFGHNYQWLKMFCMVLVFACDWFALARCEDWASSERSKEVINLSMESISKKGICPITRLSYLVGFCIDFGIYSYFTWIVCDFYIKIQTNPAYHLPGAKHSVEDFNKHIGEPGKYLGKDVNRASDTHGHAYGTMHV